MAGRPAGSKNKKKGTSFTKTTASKKSERYRASQDDDFHKREAKRKKTSR